MRDARPQPYDFDLGDAFARFRVVLVEPKYPGNVGAVARAMGTAGFRHLHLVRPRAALDVEAVKMAMGSRDVLERARTHDALPDALAGVDVALALTRFGGVTGRIP